MAERKRNPRGPTPSRRKTPREAALDVAESLEDGEEIITLSSGIRLRLQPVPPFAIRQASVRLDRPEVPTFYNEKRDREEENPNDPDYLQELEDYEVAVYQASVNLSLIIGSAVESVPEGMSAVDDSRWIEQLEAAGIEVDASTAPRRYLSWLLFYAMKTEADISAVTMRALNRAGLQEVEIAAAMASFLSRTGRRTDRGEDGEPAGEDGDLVSADGSRDRP